MTSRRIVTTFVHPPIPIRTMDWQATYDDYDADCDEDGFFSRDPVGHGATEADAVVDLIVNHPRGGIECAHDRHCGTCLHFTEQFERDPDGSTGSRYVCGLHRVCGGWHARPVIVEDTCSDHEFDGEREQPRTLPLPPPTPEDDIKF